MSKEIKDQVQVDLEEAKKNEELDLSSDDNEEDDEDEDDIKSKLASKKDKKELDVKEHIDALFNGEELSEEFKSRVESIFKTAVSTVVNEQLDSERAALVLAFEEATEEKVANLEEKFEEYKKLYEEEIEEKMSTWVDHVVEEWKTENEVQIQESVRHQISEEFIDDLRNLFLEHNMDIPEVKVDVTEKLAEAVDVLESKVDQLLAENAKLVEEKEELIKESIFATVSESLTEIQKERLSVLSEAIDYDTIEEFEKKIVEIKESYFKTSEEVNMNESGLDGGEFEISLEEEVVKPAPTAKKPGDAYAEQMKSIFKR